jgi:hypothetical protein
MDRTDGQAHDEGMSLATNPPLPTLMFAALAAFAVAGCSINVDLGDDTTSRVENDTVPVAALTRLDVTTHNGAIEVLTGTGDQIEIRTELDEVNVGDAEYSIDVRGDQLVLTGDCDTDRWSNCKVAFRVTVPAEFDVTASTDNGGVAVDGIAGDIEIDTDNGAVEGDTLASSSVVARTSNGRVRLAFEAAPTLVDAQTDNGAISIRVPDDGEFFDVDASSNNGKVDVSVRTDPESDRHVTARSSNGAIDVGYITAA